MAFPNGSYDEVLQYFLATGIAPIAININISAHAAYTLKMSFLRSYLLFRVNEYLDEDLTLKQQV